MNKWLKENLTLRNIITMVLIIGGFIGYVKTQANSTAQLQQNQMELISGQEKLNEKLEDLTRNGSDPIRGHLIFDDKRQAVTDSRLDRLEQESKKLDIITTKIDYIEQAIRKMERTQEKARPQ